MFFNKLFGLSYAKRPVFKFAFQEGHEEVLLLLRAHPVTQVPWILGAAFLSALPILLAGFLNRIPLAENQVFVLLIAWYAFCLGFILNKYFFWYFNLGLITNIRIIDIDCYNLLNTNSSATLIGKIEEVQKDTKGIFSTWFDYGDVFVQTAGEIPNVEFTKVPRPTEVVRIINGLMEDKNGG